MEEKENALLKLIKAGEPLSSKEMHDKLSPAFSYASVKRILRALLNKGLVVKTGQGKSTRYQLSASYEILLPIDIQSYFSKEIDERSIKQDFNFRLINDTLQDLQLFTKEELSHLRELQTTFKGNIATLSDIERSKEMERLAIDLSWKSSQIEGNTYSLLETERLLIEKETASGKTKDEAVMLLNHKKAIDFIVEHPDYFQPISVGKIESVHSLLVQELEIIRNIRNRRVGITGTNYRPLDNAHQIREALADTCSLINRKSNEFEKALLALVLISYIQPFVDGNKRTARIVSNGILLGYQYCPLSYRTVDALEYKKAMLLFYEQNNLSYIKEIFINQFEFAVSNYF